MWALYIYVTAHTLSMLQNRLKSTKNYQALCACAFGMLAGNAPQTHKQKSAATETNTEALVSE
jgi:hypothetical protein